MYLLVIKNSNNKRVTWIKEVSPTISHKTDEGGFKKGKIMTVLQIAEEKNTSPPWAQPGSISQSSQLHTHSVAEHRHHSPSEYNGIR